MPDYELWAPDIATMNEAIASLNMKADISGKLGNTVYAVDDYVAKFVQNGTTTDILGNTIPNMVLQSGAYANVRWMGASVLTLPADIISKGATLKLARAPFYHLWS